MTEINPTIPDILPQTKLICGFTTRSGGISLPPFDTLNLGYETSDDRTAVRQNHTILYCSLGMEEANVAVMGQVHGDHISIVDSGGVSPATDGLITSKPGVMLAVKCADCIPLLLFDPVHMVIGAIHCGWKPIVTGIAVKAVNIMSESNDTDPGEIIAAMGPSAGPCCYEIGAEVAGHFKSDYISRRNGKLYADLRGELRYRLIHSGMISNNIEIISDCTICNKSLYFSHRRDRKLSGRMMGYIMMRREEKSIH
jgi:YfiH family protein